MQHKVLKFSTIFKNNFQQSKYQYYMELIILRKVENILEYGNIWSARITENGWKR